MNLDERDPEELRGVLITALARVTGRDAATVTDGTALESLGIDSLGMAALILDLEDDLGCELPLDLLARVANADHLSDVGDLVGVLGWQGERR